MAPGISNDKTGAFTTPKTGRPEIDRQVAKLQAEDAQHLADLRRQAEQAKRG